MVLDHTASREVFLMVDAQDPSFKLIFVYNADSGLVSTLKDYVHKTVSPSTYQCNLCALTFGNVGMHNKWSSFVDELAVPVEFLHRNELRNRFDTEDLLLPAILKADGSDISVLITAKEINDLWTLDELIGLVSVRVKDLMDGGD